MGWSKSLPVKELHSASPATDSARRVAERLQGEFRSLIWAFPLDARTIGGISEWLGVTKPICQRLLRAVRHRGDALTALSFFPGVRGLRQFVQAAKQHDCDRALIAAATAAVDQYEVVIDEHGGSQTRLLAALGTPKQIPDEGPADVVTSDRLLKARKSVFEGLRHLAGREFETQVAVFLYRPCDDDPDRIDCVTAMGMIGIRRTADSLPICPVNRFSFATRNEAEGAESRVEGLGGEPVASGAPVSVLGEFCSKPLPAVAARETEGQLSVLIDPSSTSSDPLDVILGTRFGRVRHPALGEVKMQDCSLVSEGPSRNLLMSVHLHRSLAQKSIPSLACYALGNRGPVAAADTGEHGTAPVNLASQRWFDRLPNRPRLEDLGLGLEQAGSTAYPPITNLIQHLCASQAWDSNEFVGYRCQVKYPVWGVQYLMSFDFGSGQES
jgi:hypothetical protein